MDPSDILNVDIEPASYGMRFHFLFVADFLTCGRQTFLRRNECATSSISSQPPASHATSVIFASVRLSIRTPGVIQGSGSESKSGLESSQTPLPMSNI